MENILIVVGFMAIVVGAVSGIWLILTERKLHRDIAELKETINENFQQPD